MVASDNQPTYVLSQPHTFSCTTHTITSYPLRKRHARCYIKSSGKSLFPKRMYHLHHTPRALSSPSSPLPINQTTDCHCLVLLERGSACRFQVGRTSRRVYPYRTRRTHACRPCAARVRFACHSMLCFCVTSLSLSWRTVVDLSGRDRKGGAVAHTSPTSPSIATISGLGRLLLSALGPDLN
jgi:hypothetical protein